jgi:hypothetical protein
MNGAIQPDYSSASGATNYNMYFETVDPSGQIYDTIIANEKSRINSRELIIDPEYDIKLRRDHFKRSETLKKNAYHRMLMIFIIALVVSVALVFSKAYFPFIPDLVVDLLIIAIVGGALIFILTAYVDMSKRSRMDYEKVSFDLLEEGKSKKNDGTAVTDHSTYGGGTRDGSICIGGNCCPSGAAFIDNQCVKEGFTGKIEPFTPLPEFTQKM